MIPSFKICQVELTISDKDKTLDFYQNVLNWSFTYAEIHNHFIFDVPKSSPYGISLIYNQNNVSGGCRVYFEVTNIQSIKEKLEKFYNKNYSVIQRPQYGNILLCEDPSGNLLGFFSKE